MQKAALGKGLGALIPDLSVLDEKERKSLGIMDVELDKIVPNEYQPRKVFNDEKLKELAASIKEQGVIQPIIVHRIGTNFGLIAGERRWRAARLAGLKIHPGAGPGSDQTRADRAGPHREHPARGPEPSRGGRGVQALQDEFKLTQEDLARRVGKERSTITNFLRILGLPKEIKQHLATGALSMGHAKALLSLERLRDQMFAANQIVKKALSVREAEALAGRLKKPVKEKKTRAGYRVSRLVEERLRKSLGTKVSIAPKAKGGKIVIEYYSGEELERILEKIG